MVKPIGGAVVGGSALTGLILELRLIVPAGGGGGGVGGDGDTLAFLWAVDESHVDDDVLKNRLSRVWHSLSRISGM